MLASAAAIYLVAASMVSPGFYDGYIPPAPYNWVCPPSVASPGNIQPGSGHLDIKVINGVSDANSAFTTDTYPQVVVGFLPGAFEASGNSSISVDIKPVVPCPLSPTIHFVTNTYLITADSPLIKAASLELLYSAVVPAPSTVYFSRSPNGPWRDIGSSQQARPFTIVTATQELGYFAAGYPSNATRAGTTGQLLPIAVAALIIAVLIASIPLAFLRRRQASAP